MSCTYCSWVLWSNLDLPNIRLFHCSTYKVPFFPHNCISKISVVIHGSWSSMIKGNIKGRAKWCSGYNVLLMCMSRGGLCVRFRLVQYFFSSHEPVVMWCDTNGSRKWRHASRRNSNFQVARMMFSLARCNFLNNSSNMRFIKNRFPHKWPQCTNLPLCGNHFFINVVIVKLFTISCLSRFLAILSRDVGWNLMSPTLPSKMRLRSYLASAPRNGT